MKPIGNRLWRWRLVAVGACVVSAAGGQGLGPADALKIQGIKFDANTREAQLDLLNTTARIITAYSIQCNGAAAQSNDYFPSIGMEKWSAVGPDRKRGELGGVLPGEDRPFTMHLAEEQYPSCVVVAVIFNDRTGIGDEAELGKFFQRRAAEAAELARWCGDLEPAALSGLDTEAVRAKLRDLAARMGASTVPADVAASDARRTLLTTIDLATGYQTDTGLVVLRARCAAAPVHSKRARGNGQ